MTIHCSTENQTNLLLKKGWVLQDVRNSTPSGFGFVYVLIRVQKL